MASKRGHLAAANDMASAIVRVRKAVALTNMFRTDMRERDTVFHPDVVGLQPVPALPDMATPAEVLRWAATVSGAHYRLNSLLRKAVRELRDLVRRSPSRLPEAWRRAVAAEVMES